MKHTQVRIVNESGDVKFVPESITKERWFKNSKWKVQDLKVKEQEILTQTSEFFDDENSLSSDSSVDFEDEDPFQDFTKQEEPVKNKKGRKPNSEKHGA